MNISGFSRDLQFSNSAIRLIKELHPWQQSLSHRKCSGPTRRHCWAKIPASSAIPANAGPPSGTPRFSGLLKQAEADKPVTILNLNPFPLKINGGVFFPEEIAACPPGKPYTIHVIRETRWGHKDLGCDAQNMMQMEPVPAIPLVLAAEYIREYVQQDGGFGGVLCYVGDHDPATIKKGATIRVPEVAYSDRGEFYVEVRERDFHETLDRDPEKAQHLHPAAAAIGQCLV